MEDSVSIRDVASFHLQSFNYVIKNSLLQACLDIEPAYMGNTNEIKFFISDAELLPLQYPMDLRRHKRIVYPSEARLRAATYYAELHLQVCFQKDSMVEYCSRIFYIPLMVKSDLCFLRSLKEDRLWCVKEDVNDPGGYFIIKGKERIIRKFFVPRRNYPLAVCQSKFKLYGENFTEFGIIIQSVKDEHSFSKFSLHFLNDGSYEGQIYYRFRSIPVPLMLLLKALVDECDLYLCRAILKFCKDFPIGQLKNMLRSLQNEGIVNHHDAKVVIGKIFCNVVNLPSGSSFEEVTDYLFRKALLIHIDSFEDKFEFLCFAMCKLHCVVSKKIRLDDLDNPIFQEILAPGQTYILALKIGVLSYIKSLKNVVAKAMKKDELNFRKDSLQRLCNKAISFSPQVSSMIATGNMPFKIYGLMSETGFTVSLKRTNVFELAAQFNAVCKLSVKNITKNMRKYYPEAWGFLCPVQTPEGEMTGLYNQLASHCKIVKLNDEKIDRDHILRLGVLPINDPMVLITTTNKYFVFVDGEIFGWINTPLVSNLLKKLKELKWSKNNKEIPSHTELVFLSDDLNLFPGIYLFSTSCRMVRRLFNLYTSEVEIVGCFEQTFLHNLLSIIPNVVMYREVEETDILSLSANMIPFSEYNAAVRNVFASVKCKQALGLPFLNTCGRADVKSHQLVHLHTPLVFTNMYAESYFNLYPNGTNVMIAVLSYSGFDMEDAVVLNKASVQRGLMQSIVYKTIFFDFEELASEFNNCTVSNLELRRNKDDPLILKYLDSDGLPFVGNKVEYNDPILSVWNKQSKQWLIKRFPESCAYISTVKLTGDVPCSGKNIPKNKRKVSITYAIRRIPEVGDKFSNMHGGKGICSALMSPEDMPFSADGMIPDILFNPHGLPSRMSIGMLYEIEAGRVAVATSSKYRVKPFSSGKNKMYDTLGEALEKAGLCYYGTQKFYSGTSGEELEADVFSGCMYYLRLHHLVEEKYQVRSVGPVDEKTYQPINPGRSGAIRFGEMERDAILSHGAIEVTMDRLLHNSDKCYAFVCSRCKMLLYPTLQHHIPELRYESLEEITHCNMCNTEANCRIRIPYVLVYMLAELSAMNVKVKFRLKTAQAQ